MTAIDILDIIAIALTIFIFVAPFVLFCIWGFKKAAEHADYTADILIENSLKRIHREDDDKKNEE